MKRNFAGIGDEFAGFDDAEIVLQPLTYDGTSTWGKGADKGFDAFMDAAENMELYDIETNSEVYRRGIATLPELSDFDSPEEMYKTVYAHTKKLLDTSKFLTFFGGEHSVSIGVMQAFYERWPDITIVQLDAHTDLRKSYLGSEYNHACALHRASRNVNVVQVGIRSMDSSEKQYFKAENCFFAHEIAGNNDWHHRALELITDKVYITVDLDVFDPSIMPSTGTPEPGGLGWYDVLDFLNKVFEKKKVMGFDIVELAPVEGIKHPDFLAAKLYYRMLSLKFSNYEK